LIVTKELGISKEEGQDVDIATIRTGYVEALRDGAVDFSAGTAHHPLTVFPDWRGVKLLVTLSQGSRGSLEALGGQS
jgi:NitT/TauT family transport system substrate-binding protein